ncbi:hypothetical protein D3C86_1079330 [compost metagenome]
MLSEVEMLYLFCLIRFVIKNKFLHKTKKDAVSIGARGFVCQSTFAVDFNGSNSY